MAPYYAHEFYMEESQLLSVLGARSRWVQHGPGTGAALELIPLGWDHSGWPESMAAPD